MTSTPVVSIIVPVYNTENFLHRCIDSILAQTYTDFELLLIDDGSKDASGRICDEYVAKDERIRVFHKENGGVSSARNLGLDHVQGEWITFVDADDYIEENFLKSFEGNLDADLVVGNMEEKGPRGNLLENIPAGYYQSLRKVLNGNLNKLAFQAPWGKLFRKNLVDSIRFDERMTTGEDFYFMLVYLGDAKSLRVLEMEDSNVVSSHYIYLPPPSMDKKYQISVLSSVYHVLRLEEAYYNLGVIDICFEKYIVETYYERCLNDMPFYGDLWYKNKEIERICLRRSSHFGVMQWIKTWLSFHFFYRLKMHQAKKHRY